MDERMMKDLTKALGYFLKSYSAPRTRKKQSPKEFVKSKSERIRLAQENAERNRGVKI